MSMLRSLSTPSSLRAGLTLLACTAALVAAGPAQARDEPMERHDTHEREGPMEHHDMRAREGLQRPPAALPVRLDARYGHDHYYPSRGAVVTALPPGSVSTVFHNNPWYFHGGVWFHPVGPRFVVGLPPIGIFVPVLPPAYATLWISNMAYYYANGTYYTAAPGGYTVVTPPPGADGAMPLPPPPPPTMLVEPVVYPRNGQSPAQAAADRQQCDQWASSAPNTAVQASVFQRALQACMDARGYTVR